MTFLELAEKVLLETQVPMRMAEIWEYAIQKEYDKELNSSGKTPWKTLDAQMYSSMKHDKNTPFIKTNTKPKKIYLRSAQSVETIIDKNELVIEQKELKKINYLEKDLHPILTYFAFSHLRCYTKTINHSKSNKKEFGKWVHPDMVGCYFPLEDWKPEVNELSNTTGYSTIKIYSFELKRKITLANLREVFFQTVSNSTWANESYLVTVEISEDDELLNELKRLSSSFGIGVIKLNIKNPENCEILFPSKVSENLDWETINKLTMNEDFSDFLKRINNDLNTKEIRKEWYDKIIEKEVLISAFY